MKKNISLITLFLSFYFLQGQSNSIEWLNNFGGTSYDLPTDITVDDFGNVYAVGKFRDSVDFNPTGISNVLISNGQFDFFFAKYDSNGNLIWVHQIGGISNELDIRVEIDQAGNLIVAGGFGDSIDVDLTSSMHSLYAVGSINSFIAKYDSAANLIWVKQFKSTVPQSSGRYPYLRILDMKIDAQNSIYMSGGFEDSIDFDPDTSMAILVSSSVENAFIAKLDSNGNYSWAKQITSSNHLFTHDIALDASFNVYATFLYSGSTDFDPGVGVQIKGPTSSFSTAVLKLNSNGDFSWVNVIESNTTGEYAQFMDITYNNGLFIPGAFVGTVDLNPGLNSSIHSSTNSSIHQSSAFILNLDVSGNFNFVKVVHPKLNKYVRINKIANDNANGFFVSGSYSDSIDLDFGTGVDYYNSFANHPGVYLNHIDSAANLIEANVIGWGIGLNEPFVDNSNNVYASGTFRDSCFFNIPSPQTLLVTNGLNDGILLKMGNLKTSIDQLSFEKKDKIQFYPNPTENDIHLIVDDFEKAEVFNLNGQLIQISYSKIFSVKGIQNGLYLLKVYSSTKVQTTKFMKL